MLILVIFLSKIFLGTLLKNGPGMFEFGEQKASHIFDGMAMIRRYHVDQDQTSRNTSESDVSFSRRMIESDFYKGNIAEGKMTKSGIGSTPEQWGILDRLQTIAGKVIEWVMKSILVCHSSPSVLIFAQPT